MPYEKRRNGMQPVPFRNDAVPREARQRTGSEGQPCRY